MSTAPFVPLVKVLRDERVESVHFGLAVITDHLGEIVESWGDPEQQIVLRSAGKPFQAAHFVETGAADDYGVDDRELAVVIGSHGGALEHVEAVRSLLRKTDVREEELKCGTHPPFDRKARTLSRREGPTVLQNNCSGKHAAMIAGARHAGESTDDYLDPGHAWQRGIWRSYAAAAGLGDEEPTTVTDGCGAPSLVTTARAAARAYAAFAAAAEGPLARAWRAATAHPLMVAGTGRLETDLMEMFPGRVVAKSGAEGVYAIAVRTEERGAAAVLKIADGDDRRSRTAASLFLADRLLELEPDERAQLAARHLPPVKTLTGRGVGRIVCVAGDDAPPMEVGAIGSSRPGS